MLLSNDKTDIGIKKTSAQWQSLYPYPKVLDPDGWDRKNYDYSWNEELITLEEYNIRVSNSTCMNYVTSNNRRVANATLLFLLKILLFMQNF